MIRLFVAKVCKKRNTVSLKLVIPCAKAMPRYVSINLKSRSIRNCLERKASLDSCVIGKLSTSTVDGIAPFNTL